MFLLLISGCFLFSDRSPIDDDDFGCTADIRWSVTVTVIDPEGDPVSDARLYFRSDSDAGDCESWGDGTYACGEEVAGELTIEVEHDSLAPASANVTVLDDICHVITEELEIALEYPECPDVDAPAVLAEVFYEDGTAHGDAEVWWDYPNADMEPQPCEPYGESDEENLFVCAWGLSGDFGVWATSAGGASEYALVEVGADICGSPETEEVSLVIVEDLE